MPESGIAGLVAERRTRTSWNDRLAHWEQPASPTEEANIERAASMVRAAIAGNRWLINEGLEVRPQGSYFNNTNVRRESDMDLCAWIPATQVLPAPGLSFERVDRDLGYSLIGRQLPDVFREMRAQLHPSLAAAFGRQNVLPGKKAFRISGIYGSRADADLVPACRLDYVVQRGGAFPYLEAIEGIAILGTDGRWTRNFPRQHHENGKAKRERTRHRFKKVVRALKCLRDELVTLGHLRAGQVPSFLIESLAYAVEDEQFLYEEDRYDRSRRVLLRMWDLLSDASWVSRATEINGLKLLFEPNQPWTADDAKAFVRAGWNRLAS